MKLVKLKGVTVPELEGNLPPYASRRTPKGMPRLHMLSAVIGSRGSGKTTAVLRMLKLYVQSRSYDKIFWFSPTARREQKMQDFMKFCEGKCDLEIIDQFDEREFLALQDYMRSEIDGYKEYQRKLEVWRKFCRADVDSLTIDELWTLDEMGWVKPTTDYKFGHPSFCICWDDCVGDKKVFSANCRGATSQFWILHRHLSCSVFLLSQIHANGIPRAIRSNISLFILFACKSETLRRSIAEEIAFRVEPQKLLDIWDFATRNPHDFLMVDSDCSDDKLMFRRNYDSLIWEDHVE